jgi:hypothetical protein
LVCAEPTFDFGQADNQRDIEHVFVLKNEGDAPLQIDRVRTGCGCASADVSPKVIPPGKTAALTMRLSLRGRSGAQRIIAYAHSNDPVQPFLQVACVGTATAEVDVQPRTLTFTVMPGEPPAELTATLTNRSDAALRIIGVELTDGPFSARVETNIEGRLYRIGVRVETNGLPEIARGELTILTGHLRYPRLGVTLLACRQSALAVAPRELLFLHKEGPPRLEERHIIVRSPRQNEFAITGIDATRTGLEARVTRSGPGWYSVTLGPLNVSPELDGAVIRLHTDVPGAETLEIPVRVIVPRTAPKPAGS